MLCEANVALFGAAVYFLYDLSPITVTIREERRSFLHFITRLCAVLGGTFALTGLCSLFSLIVLYVHLYQLGYKVLSLESVTLELVVAFNVAGMLDRWMYRLVEALTKPNSRSIVR